MKRIQTFFVVFFLLFLPGCFELEQEITIQKDLSGEASFSMVYDMGPMIEMMNSFSFSNEKKKKSPQEALQEAKEKAIQESFEIPSCEEMEEMNRNAPAGISFQAMRMERDDLKIKIFFKVAFKKLENLSKVDFSKLSPLKKEGKKKFSSDLPMAPLEVEEKDGFLFLKAHLSSPSKKRSGHQTMDPAAMGMMKGFHFGYKIRLPFPVVEDNAHKVEKDLFIWDFDFAKLQQLEKEGKEIEVFIKAKKQKKNL